MTSSPSDIAATIVKVVRAIQEGKLARVPPITELSELRVLTKGSVPVVRR